MDIVIDKSGYWKPHVTNYPALSVPTYQKLLQHVKNKLMFPMTHLPLKIFPNGTALMVYSLIPQSSIELLSMEFQI